MSGGWNFESSQFNRATQAQRQPGSSFKPMVYLAAMQQNLSPSQKVLDAPFVLDQGRRAFGGRATTKRPSPARSRSTRRWRSR